MKNPKSIAALIASLGILVIAVTGVNAESNSREADEASLLQNAKLTVEDAARAALAKYPGTVSSVQIYDDAGKPAFHVEVVGADGMQKDVSVDGSTGEIMKMASSDDAGERSGGHENEDTEQAD